ncbi:hypothetical protein V2I01_24395 [Micromonospora sp. BRA006-A]|nr:hypothetical protein [Micromonospora sp. BRA006-A]
MTLAETIAGTLGVKTGDRFLLLILDPDDNVLKSSRSHWSACGGRTTRPTASGTRCRRC